MKKDDDVYVFTLRMPHAFHAALQERADKRMESMNLFILKIIAEQLGNGAKGLLPEWYRRNRDD